MSTCALCSGACAEANLTPLLTSDLHWLWTRVAQRADRLGNRDLTTGTLTITAPAGAAERAAARTLLGGQPFTAGQKRRLDLTDLSNAVQRHGRRLTPGAVAAHATNRKLATKAAAAQERTRTDTLLHEQLLAGLNSPHIGTPERPVTDPWEQLRSTGWVARLHATGNPTQTLATVLNVLAALPDTGARTDRRQLADTVLDDPHGLDAGPTAALTLGLLTALGRIAPALRTRDAWAAVGVDLDDLTGGLIVLGIHPQSWNIPHNAALTLPPRTLAATDWPAPTRTDHSHIYVTENPSVLAAAAEIPATHTRVICTSGTPSTLEVTALRRLAAAGWTLHVRADFDVRGLGHVRTLLTGIDNAQPWRMSTRDYLTSLDRSPTSPAVNTANLGPTPWDPQLRATMAQHRAAAFEETLLPELLSDLTSPPTPALPR